MREQRIREAGINAITQVIAVGKVDRASKARTRSGGHEKYNPGELVDYHRPTTDKDSDGGWHGPYPVVRNEPNLRQVIIRTPTRKELAV